MAAGCTISVRQSGQSVAPSPSPQALPEPGANCAEQAKRGEAVHFGEHSGLGGIAAGQGATAVVLVHPDPGNLCLWLTYEFFLAELGYKVLALDLPGHGSSVRQKDSTAHEAVVAAVEWLRGQGATKVFLIGAAEGATAAVLAAARIKPPVTGFVSLSGVRSYGGLSAVDALRGLVMPAMFFAVDQDSTDRANATAMFNAMPTGARHDLAFATSTLRGGIALLPVGMSFGGRQGDTVHAQIEFFLRENAETQ
jgi:pimeloyl-ACP methyl ester carboxylesterase